MNIDTLTATVPQAIPAFFGIEFSKSHEADQHMETSGGAVRPEATGEEEKPSEDEKTVPPIVARALQPRSRDVTAEGHWVDDTELDRTTWEYYEHK